MLIWEPTEQSQKPIHVLSRVFQNFMRWLPKAHSIFVVVVISYGTSMQYSMLKNAEWVCRTCHSHFVKSKIPPCAVNGMAFPQKPASFFFFATKENLVLSTRLMMWIGQRKETRKPTPQASALRRCESRNCELRVVYIQKYGAKLCAWCLVTWKTTE